MKRNQGFIDVGKMLQDIGIGNTNLCYLEDCENIKKVKKKVGGFQIIFDYKGETYYYKHNINSIPYNELVAEELAKDFGISCVCYDLAELNGKKGVISKNYKKENKKYIKGEEVISQGLCEDEDSEIYNNLESIWNSLEIMYDKSPNKQQIVSKLMNQLVDIFLFDIISCQYDRHSENWELEIGFDDVNIGPLYDNEGILPSVDSTSFISLTVEEKTHGIISCELTRFQKISGREFTEIIKNKLWIISEENVKKIFERIENRTGYPLPDIIKKYYLEGYKNHFEMLQQTLKEIEENSYEGKNR